MLTTEKVHSQFEDILECLEMSGTPVAKEAMKQFFDEYVSDLRKYDLITAQQADTISNPY